MISDLNDVTNTWDNYSHYISKSRISIYNFCPLQFKKLYIDEDAVRDDPNYAMVSGSRQHEFFEKFFDVASQYPVDKWEDFIHPNFSEIERDQIQWFINQERDRLELHKGNFETWMPAAREHKVLDHEHQLRAIIDRIDILNDVVCIIEYKTGKSFYKPSLQKELGFYKFILQSDPMFAGKDCVGCVINPRLKIIEFISPSRESTILKNIEKLREAIKNNDFPATCTETKLAVCGKCTPDECGLYNH